RRDGPIPGTAPLPRRGRGGGGPRAGTGARSRRRPRVPAPGAGDGRARWRGGDRGARAGRRALHGTVLSAGCPSGTPWIGCLRSSSSRALLPSGRATDPGLYSRLRRVGTPARGDMTMRFRLSFIAFLVVSLSLALPALTAAAPAKGKPPN